MRHRLSLTWTISILAAALVPLAVAAWATLAVLERAALDAAERSRVQLARAASAVLAHHLDTGRNKLVAMAALLRDADEPRSRARDLDRGLAPRDVFLEVGIWSARGTPQVVAQSQIANFTPSPALDPSSNTFTFDDTLQQWVEAIPPTDPRITNALAGRPFVANTVEAGGDAGLVSLAAPIAGEQVLLAKLDLAPLRALFADLRGDAPRELALVDERGVTLLAVGDPHAADGVLESTAPAGHAAWSLRVRENRAHAVAPLRDARVAVAWGFGLACVLGVVLSLLFARRVVAPVRALARTAERFGAGELDARTGIVRTDEIGQLAAAFDRMAESLAELDRLKSEFVAHVSHELRTPLTSAKLTLANVEDGLAGVESLARVRADLDRLVRMVDELLDLARIEAGIALVREEARLEDVARAAVDTLRPLARVSIEVRGSSDTFAFDRARVHQIVVNLVANALRHAHARVSVEIGPRELTVTDDGPGVPPEKRERIFERFVQLDPAAGSRGAGLGLAIARKLAELHGATLRCTGASFVLRF